MTSNVLRRHPVAFEVRAPGKSESVYYKLQFCLFLGHFWTSPGLVIFSPETFPGKPTWLVMLRGYLAPFALPREASKQRIFSFSWNPKFPQNERKGIHIFIPSHMTHFHWSHMALEGILWHSELGPRKSPKACIVTFNFGCFWDIFLIPWLWSYFLPKHS